MNSTIEKFIFTPTCVSRQRHSYSSSNSQLQMYLSHYMGYSVLLHRRTKPNQLLYWWTVCECCGSRFRVWRGGGQILQVEKRLVTCKELIRTSYDTHILTDSFQKDLINWCKSLAQKWLHEKIDYVVIIFTPDLKPKSFSFVQDCEYLHG